MNTADEDLIDIECSHLADAGIAFFRFATAGEPCSEERLSCLEQACGLTRDAIGPEADVCTFRRAIDDVNRAWDEMAAVRCSSEPALRAIRAVSWTLRAREAVWLEDHGVAARISAERFLDLARSDLMGRS